MIDKCIIIFSGYNQRAVIAFLRTLKKHQITFGIIASHQNDFIFETEYKENVLATRKCVQLDIEDIISSINSLKTKIFSTEYLIAPSTEALNRFILKHRLFFEKESVYIPLVNEKLYEKISDKIDFSELCLKSNVDIPIELFDIDKIQTPFVAKPKNYLNSKGKADTPFLILNKNDKAEYISKNNINDFYYQEYITGRSFYLLYYFDKNGNCYKFSQENLIQQPNGKSILAAIPSNLHNLEISSKYEQLLKAEKFYGLIMIEVIKKDNRYLMIEANPRFWGPSQLFIDAGANLFEVFLSDHGIIENLNISFETTTEVKYFWLGGIIQTLKSKENLKFHNGTEIDLYENLPNWLKYDIYRRNDTYKIFKKELE